MCSLSVPAGLAGRTSSGLWVAGAVDELRPQERRPSLLSTEAPDDSNPEIGADECNATSLPHLRRALRASWSRRLYVVIGFLGVFRSADAWRQDQRSASARDTEHT